MAAMDRLMDIGDEKTFDEALEKDFKITPKDPRYAAIKKIWRGE